MGFKENIREEIATYSDELSALRRYFHQHPEIGFEEENTSKAIFDYLSNLGLEPKKIAKTGVIATLFGAKPGKVIAFRADMDALPVTEENDHEYTSKRKGVMHACGHDGHMAILLCMAKYLVKNKEKLQGTIRFIFQPGEEGYAGAVKMIEDGALRDPAVEAVFGLHLMSHLPIGKVNVVDGPVMSNATKIDISIFGKSGHGAIPERTIDPIVAASTFVSTAQTIISRNLNPLDPGVITFGRIRGGSNFNVIAPHVKLSGTLRAMSEDTMGTIKRRMGECLDGLDKTYGVTHKVEVDDGYPALVNDPKLTTFVRPRVEDIVGGENITEIRTMTGEDFAFYALQVPSQFLFVGCSNKNKGIVYPQHHSKFEIDEDALVLGLEIMAKVCEDYLEA
jgi:amidohydrolase